MKDKLDPNKEYIVFEKETYDEMQVCNKTLKVNAFFMGIFVGILATNIFIYLFVK